MSGVCLESQIKKQCAPIFSGQCRTLLLSIDTRQYLKDAAGQVKALTARAEKAEARAANFEGQIEAERQADTAEADNRSQAWDQIRLGMTRSQVEALLGIPQRITGIDPNHRYYYGIYPFGGEVNFREGTVSGWNKP